MPGQIEQFGRDNGFGELVENLVEERVQDLVFTSEVVVDDAWAGLGAFGDQRHGGAGESGFGHLRQRGV